MRRIFLSHIEKDLPVMQEISQGLESSGYRTWYFERDVVAGMSYLIQITQDLAISDNKTSMMGLFRDFLPELLF